MPDDRWYSQGLRFACTQCGNCCSGPQGYVWAGDAECRQIAEYLKVDLETFKSTYARRVGARYSLQEQHRAGGWDCIFLVPSGDKRICGIYPVRPAQCRTWPFWDQNLESAAAWQDAARGCPGMNRGKHFDLAQIEIKRNAPR